MKKIILVVVCSLLVLPFVHAQSDWNVSSYKVSFKVKNAGMWVEGSLKDLKTNITFDPNNLSASTIKASVGVNTINTGIEARDNHLKKDEYFNAAKYPRIQLNSTKMVKGKDGKIFGYFDLTMKGVKKSVTIPFRFSEANGVGTFKGEFSIDRLDYAVGESSWILNDDVYITLEVKAKQVLNANK